MQTCGEYRAKFGKGPIWQKGYGLIWIDITDKKIIVYDPRSNKETIYDAIGSLRALVPLADGQFVGIYMDGLYYLNFKLGIKKNFVQPESLNDIHFLNEGKCGPDGKIWVGSSDGFYKRFKESSHTAFSHYPFENAKLYTIDAKGQIEIILENLTLSTGFEWCRKTNKVYVIDALRYGIFQYKIVESGQLQFERNIYTFDIDDGFPNGITIDENGNLWVVLFKGNMVSMQSKKKTRVLCINPEDSSIVQEIALPVTNITSCVIGGEKLDRLYVTTAYEPLPLEKVKEEPLAGYLLEIEIRAKGLNHFEFDPLIKVLRS